MYCHHRLVILRRKYRKYTRCLEYRYYLLQSNCLQYFYGLYNVFNFTCPCTCVLYIVLSFIFFFSIFIYPAIITIIITVLSFPLGLGQFMAGEVSVSIYQLLLLFATLHYCTRISCLHYTLCIFLMLTFCLYSACTYKDTVILGMHMLIVCVCVNLVPLFAHDNSDHDACLRL